MPKMPKMPVWSTRGAEVAVEILRKEIGPGTEGKD
jgi:hypothetical protein